eukprot:1161703-Pelagomonas_calceolata.AAC.1
MGSIDSPTHTQKDCVESDLSALKLFYTVHCVVAVRLLAGHRASCLAGFVLLLTSSLRLILRSTRCEGGAGGLFGLAVQGSDVCGALACKTMLENKHYASKN